MKNSAALRATVLALVCAGALAGMAACTNPVFDTINSKSFVLAGKWGNSAYQSAGSFPKVWTLILGADGNVTYKDMYSTYMGTYKITSSSVSGSARTYTLDFNIGGAWYYYCLVRVTNGTSLEIQSNGMMPYPTSISGNMSDLYYASLTAQ